MCEQEVKDKAELWTAWLGVEGLTQYAHRVPQQRREDLLVSGI